MVERSTKYLIFYGIIAIGLFLGFLFIFSYVATAHISNQTWLSLGINPTEVQILVGIVLPIIIVVLFVVVFAIRWIYHGRYFNAPDFD